MALVQYPQFTDNGLAYCQAVVALRPACAGCDEARLSHQECAHSAQGIGNREKKAATAVNLQPMRVFGIDCGTEITGFGVVESDDSGRQPRLICMAKGAIRLPKAKTTAQRLEQVFRELSAELERWRPEVVAIEEVFYSVNAKSALKLGQVRGVALLAAACQGLPVAEYAPLKIKSSVVGYGLAKKEQVQFMVARLLELDQVPEPADVADALAIAICHIHTAQTLTLQGASR
jgi:crossover junction endodeoxyribonuclease RuvC